MDLNTFIVAVFCLIDDRLKERRIRSRGPAPKLSDAEVLTIEVLGESLEDYQSHRVYVCSGEGTYRPYERAGIQGGGLGDDLQVDRSRRGEVEEAHWLSPVGAGESRSEVR